MNFIAIHGRLTVDPELRQTQSGVSVCSFSVAVDRAYQKEEKQADFFSVTAWRGTADFVSKYFQKGKEIIVTGEMQSRKYQDKEGNNRVAWEIQATSVEFCGSKSANPSSPTPAEQSGVGADVQEIDGELPF